MLQATLNSLSFLQGVASTRVIISHDGCRPETPIDRLQAYEDYFDALQSAADWDPSIRVVRLKEWGGLTGNLTAALEMCETPYVLIVQHDLPFTSEVPLRRIVGAMEMNPDLRCVRFNREANNAYGFDAFPRSRSRRYRQRDFTSDDGSTVEFTQTIGWSDNNHVCRVDYYRDIILPLCGRSASFPEDAANRAASPFLHRLFGTYIFGGLGMHAVISHLDGREAFDKLPPLPSDRRSKLRLRIRRVLVQIYFAALKVRYRFAAYGLWLRDRYK